MKILAVLPSAATRTGGPAAFVGEAAVALRARGHEVTIVAPDLALIPAGPLQRQRRVRREDLHPSLRDGNVGIYPARFPRRLAYSPALGRSMQQMAAAHDVVHLHNLWQFPQYAGYRAAIGNDTPFIVSPHGAFDPFIRQRGRGRKRIISALYQNELLRSAALIHVTTLAEADSINDIAPEVPRAIVPCGVELASFDQLPPRAQIRQTRLGGYQGPLISFLGRLAYKKGIEVLLDAFALLRAERECKLAIVGPDDEGLTPRLHRQAAALGVSGDVHVLGPLYGTDRAALLAATDVWALASHAENFGIAVLEALAAGCPVVVSPHVMLASELQPVGAVRVAENQPKPFAEALRRQLDDPQPSRDARVGAARAYDWSEVAPRLAEMYERAIGIGSG